MTWTCAKGRVTIHVGDCRETLRALPDASVHCVVTSPPYFGLRDYGHAEQIGLEPTPREFVSALVDVFREVRRVLRDDGTVWLNLGDSYASGTKGSGGGAASSTLQMDGRRESVRLAGAERANRRAEFQPTRLSCGVADKNLIGIPWRVAFALQDDGWYLRQDIIWAKPNPMPESVRDRCTKAHEYVFLLSKSPRYFFDQAAIAEAAAYPAMRHKSQSVTVAQEKAYHGNAPTNLGRCGTNDDGTRNRRSVWSIASQPFDGSHFATMPPRLAEDCIKAGCPKGGVVLDPFGGAGTTGLAAARHGRNAILCELNPEYAALARNRIAAEWREPVAVKDDEPLPLFGGAA